MTRTDLNTRYKRGLPPHSLWLTIALAVLGGVLFLVLLYFMRTPRYEFSIQSRDWIVTSTEGECALEDTNCLRPRDQIRRIGTVTHDQFRTELSIPLPDTRTGSPVEVEFTRPDLDSGVHRLVLAQQSSRNSPLSERLKGFAILLLPLTFWITGTAAVLFLRPLEVRGRLFAALFYCLALMFAAGWSSWSHVGYSWHILVITIWAFVSLTLHFHLVTPKTRYPRLRRWIWLIYLVSLVLCTLDLAAAEVMPMAASAFVVSLVGSAALLIDGWIRSHDTDASRIMSTGLILGTAPILLFAVPPVLGMSSSVSSSQLVDFLLGVMVVSTLPIWPMTYSYVVFSKRLPDLGYRANRLLGRYGFYALLLATFFCLQGLVVRGLTATTDSSSSGRIWLPFVLIASGLLVVAAPVLQHHFARWVDRRVFGLRYDIREVLHLFAQQIATATDLRQLRQLIRSEILPTLMIRRSALYLLRGDEVETVLAAEGTMLPSANRLQSVMLDCAEGPIKRDDITDVEWHQWARLIVPVSANDRALGVWLFGGRDPDDSYPPEDIEMLEGLANLVAAVAYGHQANLAKSRFLANVSHELRTPLNGMLGNLELLRHSELTDEQQRRCETIHESGESLRVLVDQILDSTKLETGSLTVESQPFDLPHLIDSLVRRMTPLIADRDLELCVDYAEGLPRRFQGDRVRLEQILTNLLTNAAKFTKSGSIRIVVEAESEGDRADVRLSVIDTGIGIAESYLEIIFDKFAQVDTSMSRSSSGAGLGLAISRQLAEQLNGSIQVTSQLEKGSTFVVELPLLLDRAGGGRQAEKASHAAQHLDGLKVLVVEDNPVNQILTEEMLRTLEAEVEVAGDGRQALEVLAREEFGVVLMDCQMPVLDGIATTREIRRLEKEHGRPRLPIVGLTAHGFSEQVAACLAAGMDDVLIKPVSLKHLASTLVRQLGSAEASD